MLPVVIGGNPGCGKTTLAAQLALQHQRGVHLHTDDFYGYISHPLDPSKVESHNQNQAVGNAYCAAAKAYSDAGYTIYIDGVVGPWHLAQLHERLGSFHYLLLHAPIEVAQQRVAARAGQSSARPSMVERMHKHFDAVIEQYARHVVMTDTLPIPRLVDVVQAKIEAHECVVRR